MYKFFNNSNKTRSMITLVMLFFAVFCSFNTFSQSVTIKYPALKIINEDTLIVFKIEQAKQLSVWNEERKECLELNQILQNEIKQKDLLLAIQTKQLADYEQINVNNVEIIKQKNDLINLSDLEKIALQQEIKKQKRHKWFAIGGGVVMTGILTYFVISK